MIQVKNTPNLAGISIHGDFTDLKQLHTSLHRYLSFYQQNNQAFDYADYEYMLGLCYDIRHAFQGDRNIESVENNSSSIAALASCIYQVDEDLINKERKKYSAENLYFSVEVLYPLALYYMFSLQEILDGYYLENWFDHLDFPYEPHEMRFDRSVIQLFLDSFWGTLIGALPANIGGTFYKYFEAHISLTSGKSLYAECLCQYYMSQAALLPKDVKQQFLLAICYQLTLFSGRVKEYKNYAGDYNDALKTVREKSSVPPLSYTEFHKKYMGYFRNVKDFITEEEEENFKEKYFGKYDWEQEDW